MVKIFQSIADPEIGELLKQGAIGVLPTDTLYGLVACAADQTAVERLYNCKARIKKLGTIIAASTDQLIDLGLKPRYIKAVAHLWPNPLSIIIPVPVNELQYLHRGVMGLAVRIPKDGAILSLLYQTGPLLTTSANRPDEPPATTIDAAKAYFGGAVDFYVQGGDLSHRPPSTIIRIIDDAIEVVRPGAVEIDDTGHIISTLK